ncbi:MAG: hypothetical protein ABI083_05845 [Lapillicoccus sp.]
MTSRGPAPLSPHDSAIWHTVDINIWLDEGHLERRAAIGTRFPLRFDADERALAQGDFTLLSYVAAGDGSYTHNGGFFFATGAAGLALTAVAAAGRAAANSRRRAQAAAEAAMQWRPTDGGQLTVTSHGFYLAARQGFYPWVYPAIDTASMMGPQQVQLSGQSDHGPVQWVIVSVWAELIFTLWARAVHPRHPQIVEQTWIPPGWLDRLKVAGHVLPAHPQTPQDRVW